jgi:hypothetical protein
VRDIAHRGDGDQGANGDRFCSVLLVIYIIVYY